MIIFAHSYILGFNEETGRDGLISIALPVPSINMALYFHCLAGLGNGLLGTQNKSVPEDKHEPDN
jgi:hypothetical protein